MRLWKACIIGGFFLVSLSSCFQSQIVISDKDKQQFFDAIKNKDTYLTETLIKKFGKSIVNIRDHKRMAPLMYAAQQGSQDIVKLLILYDADSNRDTGGDLSRGETALMFASQKGFIDIIKTLIAAGANVNACAFQDQPSMGSPVLRYAIESGMPEPVQVLLDAGAQSNVFTDAPIYDKKRENMIVRNVPLISFAIASKAPIAIIKKLIDNGVDINKKAFFVDLTPLMVAAYTGYADAVNVLLKAGADKTIQNKYDDKKTALDYAKEKNHDYIVQLLQ